jgi:hypothetical protein
MRILFHSFLEDYLKKPVSVGLFGLMALLMLQSSVSAQQVNFLQYFPSASVTQCIPSANGKYYAVSSVSYMKERKITLFDDAGQMLWEQTINSGGKELLAFSEDDRYLFFSPNAQGTGVGVLDLTSRKIVHQLNRHQSEITALSVCPVGKYLATAGKDGNVRFWEYKTSQFVEIQSFKSNQGTVSLMTFSPNGRLFATHDQRNTVTLWELRGKTFSPVQSANLSGAVRQITFGKDNQELLILSEGKELLVYQIQQGRFVVRQQFSAAQALGFSLAGRKLLVFNQNGQVETYLKPQNEYVLQGITSDHTPPVVWYGVSGDFSTALVGGQDNAWYVWKEGNLLTGNVTTSQASGLPPILRIEEITFSEPLLTGDATAILEIKVQNHGQAEAKSVAAFLKTNMGSIEVPAQIPSQRIPAGAMVSFVIPIHANAAVPNGLGWIDATIVESTFNIRLQASRVNFKTQALPSPRLTLSGFQAVEYAVPVPNQQIDLNEMFDVVVSLKNNGQGVARRVKVSLESKQEGLMFLGWKSGDRLLRDAQPLEDIEVQGEAIFTFRYFLNSGFTDREMVFDLTVEEYHGQFGWQQTQRIPVSATLQQQGQVVLKAGRNAVGQPAAGQSVRLSAPKAQQTNPNGVAILIGNQQYRHKDVPAVDFALEDVQSMKLYLMQAFGFREENILVYPNATQAELNALFGTSDNPRGRVFNLVRPGVTDLFIYYSGHGVPDVQTGEPYLVPVDADPSLIALNGYALQTLYKNLAEVQFGSLTLLMDACFSGGSANGSLLRNISPVFIHPKARIMNHEKAMVFTSSTGNQVSSWYAEQRQSLFTYFFLKGLSGEADTNKDGTITAAEMHTYLLEQVPFTARRLYNREQSPGFSGAESATLIRYFPN